METIGYDSEIVLRKGTLYMTSVNRANSASWIRISGPWLSVSIISLCLVASMISRNATSMVVPEVKTEFSLSDFEVGLLQGPAFAVSYGIGSLLIGVLADRHPKSWILFGGVGVGALAALWTGLAGTVKEFFCSRMLLGLAQGTVSPCGQTIISSLFPASRLSLPMSVMASAGLIGLGLSYGLGGWLLEGSYHIPIGNLVTHLDSWRHVLIMLALPSLIVLFLIPFIREAPSARGADPSSWRACLRHFRAHKRAVGGIILSYSSVILIAQATSVWTPTYARRVLGISAGEIGQTMLALMSVGGVLGMIAMGILVDRLASRGMQDAPLRVSLWSLCIGIPISAIGFLVNSETLLYVSILSIQLTIFSLAGILNAALHIVTPEIFRVRMSSMAVFSVTFCGFALGPVIVGTLTDFLFGNETRIGVSIATLILSFGLATILLIWFIRPSYVRYLKDAGSDHQ